MDIEPMKLIYAKVENILRYTMLAVIMLLSAVFLLKQINEIRGITGIERLAANDKLPFVMAVYIANITFAVFEFVRFRAVPTLVHDFVYYDVGNEVRKHTCKKETGANLDVYVNVDYGECAAKVTNGMFACMRKHYIARILEMAVLFASIMAVMHYVSYTQNEGILIAETFFMPGLRLGYELYWEKQDIKLVNYLFLADFSRAKLFKFQRFELTLDRIKEPVTYDGKYLYYGENKISVPIYSDDYIEGANVISVNAALTECIEGNKDLIDFEAKATHS